MQGKSQPKLFNDESSVIGSTPANVYRLPLPLEKVFLIDDARSLRECTRVLCAVGLYLVIRYLFSFTILYMP